MFRRFVLGCMGFGKPGPENGVFSWAKNFDDAKLIFKKTVDLGINYFDTANVYQLGTSEKITEKLIREFGLLHPEKYDTITRLILVNYEKDN